MTRKIIRALAKIKLGYQENLYLGNLNSLRDWGTAKILSNLNIIVPHKKVARIQERHIFLGHFIL